MKSARAKERQSELNLVENCFEGTAPLRNNYTPDEPDRIAALKVRKAETSAVRERFQFVSGESLRLPSELDRKR